MAPCRSSSIWISPTAGGAGKQKPFDFVDFVDDVAIPMFDGFRQHARLLKDTTTFLSWHPKLLSQTADHKSDPRHDEKHGNVAGLVESDVSDPESGDESYAVGKGILVRDGLEYEPDANVVSHDESKAETDDLKTGAKDCEIENDSDVELDHQGDNYEGDEESIGSDDADDDESEASLPMEFPLESVPHQLVRVVGDWVAHFDEDDIDCKDAAEDCISLLTDERNEESSDESFFGQSSEGESEEESNEDLDGESDDDSSEDSDDSIEDYQQHDISSDDDSEHEVKSLSARLANVVDKWGIGNEEEGGYSSEDSLTSEEDDEGDDAHESDVPFDEGGYENDADEVSTDEEGSLYGEADELSATPRPKHVQTNLPACQIPLEVILALNNTDLD
jgi:hypothetical protein